MIPARIVSCSKCGVLADNPDGRNEKHQWVCLQCAEFLDHQRRIRLDVLLEIENQIAVTPQPVSLASYERARLALSNVCNSADELDSALVVFAHAVGL